MADKKTFDPAPYADLLKRFEAAALEDISYAIAIAKAAGPNADRRGLITADRNGVPREQPSRTANAPGRPKTTGICPPDHKHAQTGTCYTTHKCRCTECRAAKTADNRRRRREFNEKLKNENMTLNQDGDDSM